MINIHKNVENYYTNKIKQYGPTPKGVDWNGEESQFIRFEQLSKIIKSDDFSITDIGCGYGKYTEYLQLQFNNYAYHGYDLSEEMIINAKNLYTNNNIKFTHINNLEQIIETDYLIASGIFSVKMTLNENQWLKYILDTLQNINKKSTKAFSFNMLTKYSDKEYMRDDLYYADPLFFFDYCKKNFSRNISLNHDYDLYEFTIIVKKD